MAEKRSEKEVARMLERVGRSTGVDESRRKRWSNPVDWLDNLLYLVSTFRSSGVGDPVEDRELYDLYFHILAGVRERYHYITVPVVGVKGAGKSTLVSNMLQKPSHVDKKSASSENEGIHVDKAEYVVDSGEDWVPNEPDLVTEFAKRLDMCVQNTDMMSGCVIPAEKEIDDKLKSPHVAEFFQRLFPAWHKELMKEKKSTSLARVTVLDFAGKHAYLSTYHRFLNSKSIYLLVADVSKPLRTPLGLKLPGHTSKESTSAAAVQFWLRCIYRYSRDAVGISHRPTVVLVGTHKDQLKGTESQKMRHMENFFNTTLKSLVDLPVTQIVHSRKFLVGNSCLEDEFTSIRKEVMCIAEADKNDWEMSIPLKWTPLERLLRSMEAQEKGIISRKELNELDKSSEYPLQDPEEIEQFIDYHQKQGNVLCVQKEESQDGDKDFLLTNTRWIDKAFNYLAEAQNISESVDDSLWIDFNQKAILHPELINTTLDKHEEYSDRIDEVVTILEHLGIIYRWQSTDIGRMADDGPETSNIQDVYIAPSMQNHQPPDHYMEMLSGQRNNTASSVLCFKGIGTSIVPTVFYKVIVSCIRKWAAEARGFKVYDCLAAVYLDKDHLTELILWLDKTNLFTKIKYHTASDKPLPGSICVQVRQFLETTLNGIFRTDSRNSHSYTMLVHCGALGDSMSDGLLTVGQLKNSTEIRCEVHQHTVVCHNLLRHWFDTQGSSSNDRVPTDDELAKLSRMVGMEYMFLGIELGVSKARIDQLNQANRENTRQTRLDILYEWREMKGSAATVQSLKTAMRSAGTDPDAADKIFG